MLLTISSAHERAADLSYLLHKHPDRLQSVDLSVGVAHIFYPEFGPDRSTIALLLDVNPIDLVRGAGMRSGNTFSLRQYVNDRPYVASSLMSVAMAKAFSTAMNGRCKDRPELVDTALPFEVTVSVLPAPRGGERLIREVFEPLGYTVSLERHALDSTFPEWGESKYYTLRLSGLTELKSLLSHLYVLIPALDNDKHYFVSRNEVDKLLDKGKGWLEDHPAREHIVRRYLLNLRGLANHAIARLEEGDAEEENQEEAEKAAEKKAYYTLHQQRLEVVLEKLVECGAQSVVDLGCGEGKLIRMLLKKGQFRKITGMDVSFAELRKARQRLHWDKLAPKQKERLDLFQGSLVYKDARLAGFDAAAIVEVIEHLDEYRLRAFEQVVFRAARPRHIVLTTPNVEYNVLYETLEAGKFRHTDHRFEWTRKQFQDWATAVAETHGYEVAFYPIGEVHADYGAPSQMAHFSYDD